MSVCVCAELHGNAASILVHLGPKLWTVDLLTD